MSHTCHATGCDAKVPPSMWGCRKHWFMLPKLLRDRIWRHYRKGQEDDKRPSREYLLAARDAVVHIAGREGVAPDTRLYDVFLGGREALNRSLEESIANSLGSLAWKARDPKEEAERMRALLVKHGFPEDSILSTECVDGVCTMTFDRRKVPPHLMAIIDKGPPA